MDSEILALADRDKDYLEKFNNYLSSRYGGIFECHSFTDREHLLDYGLKNEITVLLIEEGLYDESLRRINPKNTYILDEEGNEGDEDSEGISRISRYKSADSIIRQILSKAELKEENRRKAGVFDCCRLYTVYSPVGRCLKTTLAVAVSQLLSDRGRTLYINTESFSGFNQIFMSHYEGDLSDILFYLRNNSANFPVRLQSMVMSSEGYDYIPPGVMPEDICTADPNLWEELFSAAAKCGYEYIVLDMGAFISGMLEIMKKSERIFMPVRSDTVSRAKLNQFEALLHISGNDEILGLIDQLSLPYFEGLPSIAADLRLTALSEYIRGRLQ